jgi:hypothetical protein
MSFFAEVLPAFADAASAGEFKKFLAAMQQFLPFFDRMGSMFKVVKSDIGGNVDKLLAGTAKCAANATFASVIDADVAEGKTAKTGGSNAESLLWLKRAMEFIMLLLSKVSETKEVRPGVIRSFARKAPQLHRQEDNVSHDGHSTRTCGPYGRSRAQVCL